MSVKGLPIVFSVEHDKVWVRVGNNHGQHYFPSHWSDTEIEDWLWRDGDRKGYRVLRREIKVQCSEPYVNGSESTQCR